MSEQYSEGEDFQADVKSTLNNQADDADNDSELEHTEMKIPSKINSFNHVYSHSSAYICA